MNLHEPPKWGTQHNVPLFGLDWNPGFVLVIDDQWPCIDPGNGRTCYRQNGPRGHASGCLEASEEVKKWLREHRGVSQGTYQCECMCHTDDGLCVSGTYVNIGDEATMWGPNRVDDNDYRNAGDDYNRYWCVPCRSNEHHWTD